ncbi:MAG: nuclear transport factor 2 family protein [Candidatus Dormibacteraeota bacterium]|uniref:Nuclear transport factor 2 family protein n=2 Tax=Candidatus Dormiibacter inghamiae TaxID=3127013 RepID=A0A934KJE6_9BACT|nr:nuclear transport factor 2 family protein [Candidatus Dormibacteraeota bacterium]MBJ7606260.1 nuclear transport factor 2 family protein [Candidatus Dormibacteraeota bacterium]
MNGTVPGPRPGTWVERLCRATNDHDLDELTRCFAADYCNETPAHPARGFSGRAQVRKNWEQIFAAVPDLTAQVRWVEDGHTAWSEWEMRGTRRDGLPHLMRGVVIFGVEGEEATWARFYLEPVDADHDGVDAAVQRAIGTAGGPQ